MPPKRRAAYGRSARSKSALTDLTNSSRPKVGEGTAFMAVGKNKATFGTLAAKAQREEDAEIRWAAVMSVDTDLGSADEVDLDEPPAPPSLKAALSPTMGSSTRGKKLGLVASSLDSATAPSPSRRVVGANGPRYTRYSVLSPPKKPAVARSMSSLQPAGNRKRGVCGTPVEAMSSKNRFFVEGLSPDDLLVEDEEEPEGRARSKSRIFSPEKVRG